MRRQVLAALVVAAACGSTLVATKVGGAASPGASASTGSAVVELAGEPLITSPRTRPPKGKKVDFSSDAVKAERARLAATRNEFKRWLQRNAPKARVTGEVDVALHGVGVDLGGTSIDLLRTAPMALAVERATTYGMLAHDPGTGSTDPDLSVIHAVEAWGALGKGKGVKVAIIDSGIDVGHPCFADAGYPAQRRTGDSRFTNNKVIAAHVFNHRLNQTGFTAEDVNSHGTHVAGTVACNERTPAVVDGAAIPYAPSGVAPRALLGSYNVFPGSVVDAQSLDILRALDRAYEDGFDVANMSLGGPRQDGSMLLGKAVDNADRGGMVVAVAAGNDGPGPSTVGYPGAAVRALTAGASTVGHAVVRFLAAAGQRVEMVRADFGPLDQDLTGTLVVAEDPTQPPAFPHGLQLGCTPGQLGAEPIQGKIVMLGRGVCDFTDKVRNAQAAGALAVILVNREPGAAYVASHNGTDPEPVIPAVMVSLEDAPKVAAAEGSPVTLQADAEYVRRPEERHRLASFSSRGPVLQTLAVKPDVVAPGTDVLSSFPRSHCGPGATTCWAIIGGTSMATPHLAGAAAVLRGAHPTWDPATVRSAIVNTAEQGVLRESEAPHQVTDDPTDVGAGLLDLPAAGAAAVALDPVSTSFPSAPSGTGRSSSSTVTLTNLRSTAQTYVLRVDDAAADGTSFATSTSSVALAPGASTSVRVTASTTRAAADGPAAATLRVLAGGVEVAHAPLFTVVGEGVRSPRTGTSRFA